MCLGVGFTAFKVSLKKIAGKGKRERKKRSLCQCLHTGGQKNNHKCNSESYCHQTVIQTMLIHTTS